MVRACSLFLLSAAAFADEPTPAERTDAQVSAIDDRTAAAKAASEAATQDVLDFFASDGFRAALEECCPKAAAMSAQELLDAFHAEAQVAELAHAFPATSGTSHFTDVTLDLLQEKSWFMNEWQVGYLGGATSSKGTQNAAATLYFGLPSSPDTGYTWTEASDRMIYVAHNFFQQDTGSQPNFGDVTAIFDTEYVRNMVLIAPSDTGILHMSGCDPTTGLAAPKGAVQEVDWQGNAWPGRNVNCSAWDGTVGTMEYNNHLILANFDTHADETLAGSTRLDKAKAFFQRMSFGGKYADLPAITSNEYWESNIVGNPSVEAVKFLVGNFPALFGTDDGKTLQQSADALGLPLAWAYGAGVQSSRPSPSQSMPGNRRLLDPSVLQTNATLASSAADAFQAAWEKAASDRSSGTTITSDMVETWWTSLADSQVRLAPLTAGACSDTSGCIGRDTATDACVCRSSTIVV